MNPYEILEVKEGASQEEIRRAYLKLVKKYHPDQYSNNPLADLAAEKLKEVNQAYDMLKNPGGAGQGGTGQRQYGQRQYGQGQTQSSSSYTGEYASEFMKVRQLLNAGNVGGAYSILSGISLRNAEWNYLMGIVRLRQGQYDAARENLKVAAQMEPGNSEYTRAYASLNNYGGGRYTQSYGGNDCGCPLYCLPCCCC